MSHGFNLNNYSAATQGSNRLLRSKQIGMAEGKNKRLRQMLLKHICVKALCPSSMNLDDRRFLREMGQRLREVRVRRQLTQSAVADASGLHRTFIGSVERGERNLSILNLRQIARTLRVGIADLLNRQ